MLPRPRSRSPSRSIAGSASVASAQGFDPNPANRFPAYTAPGGMAQPYIGTSVPGSASRSVASQNVAPRGALQSAPVRLQSAPVRLQQGRGAYVGGQSGSYGAQQDESASTCRTARPRLMRAASTNRSTFA